MTNNEKTFEQGVAVGMLLSKGVDQGSKTYNLKDQLFKYILENGKIIGTCKVGNNCIKEYIGLVHYSDPNAKLFWTLDYGSYGIRNRRWLTRSVETRYINKRMNVSDSQMNA